MFRTLPLILLLTSLPTIAAPSQTPTPSTGHFNQTFTERNPLSSAQEMSARTRLDTRRWPEGDTASFPGLPANWATRNWDYQLKNENFTVYVPESYNPKTPHGILVWTGVTQFSPDWFPVLARHKLIFIDPDKRDRTYVPAGLWVDAVHNLKKQYNVDDTRIYTAGFSNGGRNARGALITHPDVFRGCFCIAGDDFYDDYKQAITVEGTVYAWQGDIESIKKSVRIVMMRGQHDTFTPEEGRRQFEGLILDGFRHVSFFVAPNIGHQHPNADYFEKGINALDNPPELKPPTTAPTKDPNPTPGQIAHAKRLMNTVTFWHETAWPPHPGPRLVRAYLKKILTDYPTTPAAKEARDFQDKLDAPAKLSRSLKPPVTRTGQFTLGFAESHPLANPDEVRRRSDSDFFFEMSDGAAFDKYDITEESFDLSVPASYKPTTPHGLIVWVGIGPLPKPYLESIARHKMIAVYPVHLRGSLAQYPMALDAVHNVCKLYHIDSKRIYIVGLGYGGAAAASIFRAYPEVFQGLYGIRGGAFYHSYRSPKTSKYSATVETPPFQGDLARIKTTRSIVLLRAREDKEALPEIARTNIDALQLDGFTRAAFIDAAPQPDKQEFPNPAFFEKGLIALDEPKLTKPPTTAPASAPRLLPAQIAQADRLLATARFYADPTRAPKLNQWTHRLDAPKPNPKFNTDKARLYLNQLLSDYPTTPAAKDARDLLNELGP